MPRDRSDRIRVEDVRTPDSLQALVPEWERLWLASPTSTPFQSPDWLLPWWRNLGGDGLWTLALRRQGRLIGIAPWFVHRDGAAGTRQVTFLGNGVSDDLDLILEPETAGAGAAAALAHLAGHRDAWDCADFRDLPPGSPLARAEPPAGVAGAIEEEEPCTALSPAAFPASASRKLVRNLRTARNRAERMGPVRFETAGGDNAGALFDALLMLHGVRWTARGEEGMFADAAAAAFHRAACSRLLERRWLRLHALRIGGRIAAVLYGFLVKSRAYAYLGGFDPEFEKASPGALLLEHAIRSAAREGAREFDFLRGREAYKYAWGVVERPKVRRRLRAAG